MTKQDSRLIAYRSSAESIFWKLPSFEAEKSSLKFAVQSEMECRHNLYAYGRMWMDNIASVEDMFSRKIIGWAYGKTSMRNLLKALEKAFRNVRKTEGIILQTD